MKWVVAGDRRVREQLARLLERAGHEVATCSLLDHALTAVNAGCDGLLLAPGAAWAAAMDWLHETLPTRLPTVLVAPQCEAQPRARRDPRGGTVGRLGDGCAREDLGGDRKRARKRTAQQSGGPCLRPDERHGRAQCGRRVRGADGWPARVLR